MINDSLCVQDHNYYYAVMRRPVDQLYGLSVFIVVLYTIQYFHHSPFDLATKTFQFIFKYYVYHLLP